MKRISLNKGDSKFFFVLSSVNGVLYTVWTAVYLICLILRNAAFNSAQTSMAVSGHSAYTVEVTSPFFGILKVFSMLLPVIMTVWTVMLILNDRKHKQLCDSKLILGVFAADVITALLCAADITTLHMIF